MKSDAIVASDFFLSNPIYTKVHYQHIGILILIFLG
jgi:hypothetical protein